MSKWCERRQWVLPVGPSAAGRCPAVARSGVPESAGKPLWFFSNPPPLLSGCNGVRGENLKTKLFFFVK